MIKIVKTSRGGEKLCYRGFHYIVDRKTNKKTYWICEQRKSNNCSGRVISSVSQENAIEARETKIHSHVPDPVRSEVLSVLNTIQSQSTLSIDKPENIVRGVKRKIDHNVLNDLPSDDALKQRVKRSRRKETGVEVLSGINFVLPNILCEFEDGQLFCIGDYCHEDTRLLIFSTEQLLNHMCVADMLLVDGTFKVVPSQFSQLYSVHALIKVNGKHKYNFFLFLIYNVDKFMLCFVLVVHVYGVCTELSNCARFTLFFISCNFWIWLCAN